MLFNPGSYGGKMLVFLADIVFFREVDKVYSWFGG